jgi:hypothetical protein
MIPKTVWLSGGIRGVKQLHCYNVEIGKINHFAEQGSSGGPIGMINVDLIKDFNFNTDGFKA